MNHIICYKVKIRFAILLKRHSILRMALENISGLIAFLTSLIGLIPQIYKAYISKSTKDLSMIYLINYLICSISWVVYGILTESPYVFLSNIFGGGTCVFLIIQKYKYDKYSS